MSNKGNMLYWSGIIRLIRQQKSVYGQRNRRFSYAHSYPYSHFVALVIVGAGVKCSRRDASGRWSALDVTQNPAAGIKPCCTVYGRGGRKIV